MKTGAKLLEPLRSSKLATFSKVSTTRVSLDRLSEAPHTI